MNQVRKALALLARGRLVVEGRGRTFVRVPLWLAVLAALCGGRAIRFALLTAILVVAFGMEARVERP